ncbi:ABC transporter permease [Pseudonocardia xishanensis]|uniref:Transport permease protein n=1 Tax=Pseudonocardia xishanensis TaxID=630995 RepID=A0ABP8RSI9_9PSEU
MTASAVGSVAARPRFLPLAVGQLGYALRELWRTRVVFVFTVLFPLTWLVIIGFLAGDAVVDEASGVRVMQFVTPSAITLGVLYAAFPTVAISLAVARTQGILRRLRGTPLPTGTYLAGRIAATVAVALFSTLVMLVVGVALYHVQIVWRTVPATLVTLVVGVGCFAALGLAVAAVSRSVAVASAASIGASVLLGFVSGLFTLGQLPAWADTIASSLPLKPLNDALRDQFTPFHPGAGWHLGSLAVLVAWGLVGAVVAAVAFRREPGGRARPADSRAAAVSARPAQVAVARPGRPSWAALTLAQLRWALRTTLREPGSVFFAVVMPLAVVVFVLLIVPASSDPGVPLLVAAGMTTWGAAVAGFVTVPAAFALARERGVLTRLRGTPLPEAAHLTGRAGSALATALATAVLVFGIGALALGVVVRPAGIPAAVGVLLLGTAALAACGLALGAVVPSSKAVNAIGLGILLPLSFFSDVFPTGGTPAWMSAVGAAFPLKHLANGLADALSPVGPGVAWLDVAVLVGWLVAGVAAALYRR